MCWLNLLLVNYQTRFIIGEDTSTVCILQTDCLSTTNSGREYAIKSVDAEIKLWDDSGKISIYCVYYVLTPVVANHLLRQLKYLQEGLVLFKIQQVQSYEKLVFQLYVLRYQLLISANSDRYPPARPLGLLMIYNYHLADAILKLGFNVENGKYRLLISNGSKSIFLSIEGKSALLSSINDLFLIPRAVSLESLSQIKGIKAPCISLNAPCWIAEADMSVMRIYEHDKEPTLTCANQDSTRPPSNMLFLILMITT